jgi:hypothetical protein
MTDREPSVEFSFALDESRSETGTVVSTEAELFSAPAIGCRFFLVRFEMGSR